jgi:hypothetical protein
MGFVRNIPVRDANGDDLTVYEFHDWRIFRRVRRLELCTGESVEEVNGSLVITATGEQLTRESDET